MHSDGDEVAEKHKQCWDIQNVGIFITKTKHSNPELRSKYLPNEQTHI